MEGLVEEGLVRSIGISNFSPSKTQAVLKVAKIKPDVNQVGHAASAACRGSRPCKALHKSAAGLLVDGTAAGVATTGQSGQAVGRAVGAVGVWGCLLSDAACAVACWGCCRRCSSYCCTVIYCPQTKWHGCFDQVMLASCSLAVPSDQVGSSCGAGCGCCWSMGLPAATCSLCRCMLGLLQEVLLLLLHGHLLPHGRPTPTDRLA